MGKTSIETETTTNPRENKDNGCTNLKVDRGNDQDDESINSIEETANIRVKNCEQYRRML